MVGIDWLGVRLGGFVGGRKSMGHGRGFGLRSRSKLCDGVLVRGLECERVQGFVGGGGDGVRGEVPTMFGERFEFSSVGVEKVGKGWVA